MAKYQRGTPTEDGWYWITDSEDSPPSIGIFLRLETGYRLSVMNPVGVTTIHMEIEHVLWCKAHVPVGENGEFLWDGTTQKVGTRRTS